MIIVSLGFLVQMGNFTVYGKMFPRAIILLLFLAGVGLLIKAKVNPAYSELFMEEDKLKMIVVGIISLGWVLLLKKIGFVITSFAALGVLIWILHEKRNWKNFCISFLIAAGEVAVFYLIFAKLLLVPLPSGLLF
ncbi:hypothetical protein Anamo_1374 [Calderihabitans maritimus]|uniref:DUF1468 domain-containing protein n=2 Tax=Calderihabitans maritimus TaxID=1246530 RepID=A0A1Z5HRF1_9FIRM|nr:hypothetical protein Anamo_1374 [Calderihabitans maritimus]